MTGLWRSLFPLLVAVAAPVAHAQFDPFSEPAGKSAPPKVVASLVAAQSALVPGQPLDVALKLEHPEHWHTYWLNPGLGTPTTLKWDLPAGWTASGELTWPVPTVKPSEVGNQHVYEGTVWLFTTVTPPADLPPSGTATLKAKAKWLVCDEGSACMPGGGDVDLVLPVAAKAEPVAAVQAELAKVKAAQPQSSPAWEVKLEPGWTLTLTPKDGASPDPGEIYFFDEKAVITNDPQKVTKEGGVIKIAAPATEGKAGAPYGFVHASKGWLKDGSLPSLAVVPTGSAAASPAKSEPAAAAGAAPPADGASSGMTGKSKVTFVGALVGLFLAGMILNLMPCVFPVLALKVHGFVRSAGKDRRETIRHSLAYTMGLLVFVWLVAGGMFVANKSFGADLAWGDITRYTGVLAGVVIILFLLGLNLAGLFEIGTSLTTVGGDLQDKQGYAGSFWSGALTLLISTPCSAPLMAAPMTFALKQGVLQQFMLFSVFGLGIALPYVVLSNSPVLLKKLPKPGAWMETFKKALAFPMFAATIFFFNAFVTKTGGEGAALMLWSLLLISIAAWIYGHWCVPSRISRVRWTGGLAALLAFAGGINLAWHGTHERASASGTAYKTGELEWRQWSPEVLADERAKGRAVFVDYTTINCPTCELNERVVFKAPGSDQVIAKFKELNVAPLRAKYLVDGTPGDNAIRDSLKPWEISTFPAYLMYPADPSKPAVLVSDALLSQQQVIEALEQAVQ